MGNRMMCVTTPKSGVTQGDANTLINRCVTTTTPYGGGGGGDAASPVRREVVRRLVPMPGFLCRRVTDRPTVPFSLRKKFRGVV